MTLPCFLPFFTNRQFYTDNKTFPIDITGLFDYNDIWKIPDYGFSAYVNPKAEEPPFERKEICHDL